MVSHILVPLDGSDIAEQALPHAALLARLFGARVTLARVPETMVVPVASAGVWITREIEPHEARAHAEAYLAEARDRPELAGITVDTMTPQHPVVAGLLDTVSATGADVVVLTTHGHSGITRMLLGSVAARLVQHATVPVYVVPATEGPSSPPQLRTVIVPLDGSTNAEAALPLAIQLGEVAGAALRLVQVPTVPAYLTAIPDSAAMIPGHLQQRAFEAERYLLDQSSQLADRGLNVAADVELAIEGGVETAILDYAKTHNADVILLTRHGHSGLARMVMGSITDRLLRLADRPVWVVNPATEAT